MRIPLLLFFAGLAIAQDGPVTVDSMRKADVQCRLQRYEGGAGWAVQLLNEGRRGVRVDYRALSRTASTWSGTVILRPDGDGRSMLIPLPSGADYFGADILAVTPGTITERVETRTGPDGSVQRITVLELIDEAAIAREKARAAEAAAETQRLRSEVASLRRQQEESSAALRQAELDARAQAEAARRAQAEAIAERDRLLTASYLSYQTDYRCRHRHPQVVTNQPAYPATKQPAQQKPERELTWEEFRDRELANERAVWKNP